MKILLLCAILSTLLSGLCNGEPKKPFTYENCGDDNFAEIRQFQVGPDPISFSHDVTGWVDILLKEDIPEGAQVKMKVYKVTKLFGFPVKLPAPCFAGIGSCNYDHCKFLKKFETQGIPFWRPDAEYECPVIASQYGAQNATVPMPELGPLIKFIASGEFRVEVKLVHKKTTLVCAIFTGTAKP